MEKRVHDPAVAVVVLLVVAREVVDVVVDGATKDID